MFRGFPKLYMYRFIEYLLLMSDNVKMYKTIFQSIAYREQSTIHIHSMYMLYSLLNVFFYHESYEYLAFVLTLV